MNNKRIFLSLVVFLTAWGLHAQQVEQDQSYRTGKLKNGLTYYIRHNAKDPGLADFYIAQRVGSILEEPRQRGLAHFLEHMAFNGTKNFPGDGKRLGIVPWCETIGVKFGANLNAYTSVDQTVYNIAHVPVAHEANLDSTLLILHDWSHFLLLTDQEIDKERGVIHEEWRNRQGARATQRMMERLTPVIYAGTKYEDCLPIGHMNIVDNFAYEDLRDYYRKWYRPDLQAIMVVGDIDVDRVEAKIKRLFGKIKGPKHPAERVYYPVNDADTMLIAVDKDTEQPIMLVNLYMKREATPDKEKTNVQYQRDGYIEKLITSMLNGRLQELQQQAVPPCLSASVRSGSFFVSRTKDAFSLSFGARQEDVRRSFSAAIGEIERARQHGFTASELERAKAVLLAGAERQAAEQADRRNSHYVSKALQHFLEWEPMLTADYQLSLTRQFGEETTLEAVNQATRELISDENQVLVVYAPDKSDFQIPTNEQFKAYVEEAQQAQYEPFKEAELPTELISQLPEKGSIVSETEAPFGYQKLTLSNGIEVYVKPTTLAKDQIQMRLWGEGGTSLYPDADVPNFAFLQSAITKAGVGAFDQISLRKVLTGKVVRVAPSVSDEVQSIGGTSSVKDLKTMFELTYLYFTQPRRDSLAFNGELNRMRSFLTHRDANPNVAYNDSVRSIVYGNSPRVQATTQEALDRVDYDRILAIYRDRFSDATGWKMMLVGNINLDELRPLLCQYIATLPAEGRKETFKNTFPPIVEGNFARLFQKKMNVPTTQVGIYYSFPQPFTPKADLTLDVLKRVLQIAYTDSIREEKGGTYGVSVDFGLNKHNEPNALLTISFKTDPQKYDELIPIVYRQIENIAQSGPLASSMDKVKKYLRKAYGENQTHNDYWDYLLYQYLRYGIDFHTGYLDLLDSLTSADVQQAAIDLLRANRRIEVTMKPE